MQRCSTLINPINVLQHHPYELVSAKFVRLKSASKGEYVGLLPGACYRLSLQRIHYRYKSCRATCHVTNLYPETDACKSARPKTCHNTTFTGPETSDSQNLRLSTFRSLTPSTNSSRASRAVGSCSHRSRPTFGDRGHGAPTLRDGSRALAEPPWPTPADAGCDTGRG